MRGGAGKERVLAICFGEGVKRPSEKQINAPFPGSSVHVLSRCYFETLSHHS